MFAIKHSFSLLFGRYTLKKTRFANKNLVPYCTTLPCDDQKQ